MDILHRLGGNGVPVLGRLSEAVIEVLNQVRIQCVDSDCADAGLDMGSDRCIIGSDGGFLHTA